MTQSYNVRDANYIASNALPADNVNSNGTALDLGAALTQNGARLANCELLLTAPALDTNAIPDTTTMTYHIEASATSNFASITTLAASAIVQTGNNGAAADTFRMKIPSDCPRYIRSRAIGADVGNAAIGNCAGSSMTLELLF